jgi:hypothetical protein
LLPTGSAEVVNDATPPESVAVPITDEPLRNVTLPPTTLDPLLGLTFAVSVTDELWVMDPEDVLRLVVVPITFGLTTIDTGAEEDGLNVLAPE